MQRLTLSCIPWSGYEAVARAFQGRHIRITYDRGNLEIMVVTHQHEFSKRLLARLIEMLTFVLHIPIHSGGSTTFSREVLEKGIEPDECYWIQNEPVMRGRMDFDIETDPAPDLSLEIDITRSWIDRMGIYAALRVPEVWCLKRASQTVHHLGADGKYEEKDHSRAFPFLPMDEIRRFLREGQTTDETTLLHKFHDWVRDNLAPAHSASPLKSGKNSKRNGKKS